MKSDGKSRQIPSTRLYLVGRFTRRLRDSSVRIGPLADGADAQGTIISASFGRRSPVARSGTLWSEPADNGRRPEDDAVAGNDRR